MKHDNKYDYSLTEYTYSNVKVKIICPVHGVFEQVPSKHLVGYGCSKIRDQIKNQYCIDNNIKLLRIPYTKINNIEVILLENII